MASAGSSVQLMAKEGYAAPSPSTRCASPIDAGPAVGEVGLPRTTS